MKKVMMMMTVLGSLSANAKVLSVNCQATNGKSFQMVSEIANVNTAQAIKSLAVNGQKVSIFRDISRMPIYQNGNLSMEIQFGNRLYSSAQVSLAKCNDDFEATGKAVVKEFTNGFAGTSFVEMTCSCSLK